MTTDRTTKTLLCLIAVALWGILLRSLVAPQPAQAQAARTSGQMPAITSVVRVSSEERVYVVLNGKLSMWEPIRVRVQGTGGSVGYAPRLKMLDVKPLP